MDLRCLRRFAWSLTLAAAVAMAGAIQDNGSPRKVDLFLKDADLLQATQALTKQTGIQFVIQPSIEPFGKINLSLTDVTADEAIEYLCTAAGAWAERDPNGVYIIRRGSKPTFPEIKAPTITPELPVERPKTVKKIRLMRADPKYVFDMLTADKVIDPDEGIKEIRRYSSMAGDTMSRWGGPSINVVGGTHAYPTSSVGDQSRANFPLPDSGNDVVLPGDVGHQVAPGGGGQPFGGGQPGGQPGGQTGGTQLQPGSGLVPSGIDFISYDPTDNSLVVRGDEAAIRRLQQNIALFDIAPEQVLIKVEFITTSQSVTRALGFDWLYQRGPISAGNRPGSFARAGDPIFLNYATGNVTTRLRTVLQSGHGKTVNAPIVRTLNNQIASVFQQVQTVIFINQIVNGPGGVIVTPQPQGLTVTTALIVRPRINGDRTITISLSPQIQDFGQVRRGPDGQEIPDVLSQSINVVARVKNGETIVLGGLTRKSDQSSQSRFPILGELPLIGQFFRSSNKDLNNSELLIFVTPTIIQDDDDATGP